MSCDISLATLCTNETHIRICERGHYSNVLFAYILIFNIGPLCHAMYINTVNLSRVADAVLYALLVMSRHDIMYIVTLSCFGIIYVNTMTCIKLFI